MSARAARERRPASPEKSLQRASWERLGSLSRPLGVLSGASWGVLEVSWGALGTLRASSGRLGSLRGLLEASWKPLGGLLTTKILPKNPDRGPKTVQETSWKALDYQEAPKELRKRTKYGPKQASKSSFPTTPWGWNRATPWEWPTELKSVTLFLKVATGFLLLLGKSGHTTPWAFRRDPHRDSTLFRSPKE